MEDERAGDQQIGIRLGVLCRVEWALSHRNVPARPYEPPELRDGHRPLVDPEPVQRHLRDRRFLRIEVVGSHPKLARGYPAHALRRRLSPVSSTFTNALHVVMPFRVEDVQGSPAARRATMASEVSDRSPIAISEPPRHDSPAIVPGPLDRSARSSPITHTSTGVVVDPVAGIGWLVVLFESSRAHPTRGCPEQEHDVRLVVAHRYTLHRRLA